MAWLIALDGELTGHRFPLHQPCLVGRGPHNHIVLDDARVSRQHAKISPEAGQHVLVDLQSANGSFVNDQPVSRHVLLPNDQVRFGGSNFKFVEESTLESKPPPRKWPQFREEKTSIAPPASLPPIHAPEMGPLVDEMGSGGTAAFRAGLYEMEDAERKLRVLYGFMLSLTSTLDPNELLERLVRNLFQIFPAARSVAVYLRGTDGKMALRLARSRDDKPLKPKGYSTLPPAADPPRPRRGGDSERRMQAPMIYRDIAHGVIHVEGGGSSRFSRDDVALLTGLAAQAAMALQNTRLHQESLKQERLKQDLELAKEIQKSFLPRQLPIPRGIEFVAEYRPAYAVGGDFYDVFWLGEGRIGMFIGDVSGKGVSAALLMARISSDLRLAAASRGDPASALAAVNEAVLERQRWDSFVTAVLLVLDVKTREITVANAGHPPPIIRRRTRALLHLEGSVGPAIGVFGDARYQVVHQRLAPGEALVLYTDGVVEATDPNGLQFGFERLETSIVQGGHRPASLAARLLADIRDHAADSSAYDDLTLLVCGVDDAATADRFQDNPTPVEAIAIGGLKK